VQFVRSIKGFAKAHITRPGYAIEYDYFDPRALTSFLQTQAIPNLFFAGQINGTTGYEEAAAQGLIAGMNAALQVQEKELWCPRRDEAYIGVLIDDLITCGTQEPYRMFTSRAEYRLLLREDNADLRLTAKGRALGLVSDARWTHFLRKKESIDSTQERLHHQWVRVEHNDLFKDILEKPMQHDHRAEEFLKRPEINYRHLLLVHELGLSDLPDEVLEQVEIQTKYAGYIERQRHDIEKLRKYEHTELPEHVNYELVRGLSNEVRQKLTLIKPRTIAQAGRISGVTPAALSLLLVHLKKQGHATHEA
jgi:tRNA uridine 5-carboxymethylaminomethyl modification enzyme